MSRVTSTGKHLVGGQAAVLQRIFFVAGLLQPLLVEGVLVDDQNAARDQIDQIRRQRGRVERHQRVDLIAGSENLLAGEMDLETAHAGLGAARSANLGRKIRERGDVVAGQRRRIRELRAGQLHAVARVAAKAHGGSNQFLDGLMSRACSREERLRYSWPSTRCSLNKGQTRRVLRLRQEIIRRALEWRASNRVAVGGSSI